MSALGCEGCFQSAKGQQQAYSIKKAEAAKWVSDNKKAVALYQEGYEVLYMDAQIATNEGKLIREIITYKAE